MINKSLKVILFFLLIGSQSLFGQTDEPAEKILTENEFLYLVYRYHPVAQQANLQTERGKANLRASRGYFDPELFSSMDWKDFNDKDYFRIFEGGLRVPVWFGADVYATYQRTNGVFLNPEATVPDNGLLAAGVSLNVGQGLFIDERRAALKQAKIYLQTTEANREAMLNDLLFDAVDAYWDWVLAYNKFQIYSDATGLAETFLGATKESFLRGDIPAIDTLEAFIRVQQRQFDQNNAQLKYQKASLMLSNYLWYEDNLPLEIDEGIVAPDLDSVLTRTLPLASEAEALATNIAESSPLIRGYSFKIADLEIQRRWKAEKLKPKAKVKYNFLTEPTTLAGESDKYSLSPNNYKWGFEFSFPILVRKARGDLQLAKIKIREAEYQREQKQLELRNKLMAFENQAITQFGQISLYSVTVQNYRRLLEAEMIKFRMGESSLFKVNARESYLLKARLDLAEVKASYPKSLAGRAWAAGVLENNVME